MSGELRISFPDFPDDVNSREIRDMIGLYAQYQAEELAKRIEAEARMFLRMGFRIDELTVGIYDRSDPHATYVIPTMIIQPHDPPPSKESA